MKQCWRKGSSKMWKNRRSGTINPRNDYLINELELNQYILLVSSFLKLLFYF